MMRGAGYDAMMARIATGERMFQKGAEAFAAVLREAGLDATVGSRLD